MSSPLGSACDSSCLRFDRPFPTGYGPKPLFFRSYWSPAPRHRPARTVGSTGQRSGLPPCFPVRRVVRYCVEDAPTPASGGGTMGMSYAETRTLAPHHRSKLDNKLRPHIADNGLLKPGNLWHESRVVDDLTGQKSNKKIKFPTCLRPSYEPAKAAMPGCRTPI